MASSVAVLFVMFRDRKLRVDDLLDLLWIPFIEEVLFGFLAQLLADVAFDAVSCPVVMHARAKYVDGAERFAVEFLPSEQICNKSTFSTT